MKLIPIIVGCLFLSNSLFAQTDTTQYIQVHFLYGSVPLHRFKSTEQKYFGGLHGGHVTIQVDDTDYGFRRLTKRTHIFPRKMRNSVFVARPMQGKSRYRTDQKSVTFCVPVTAAQLASLQQIHTDYLATTPFDYAFFGMRCASTTDDILAQIGVLKKKGRFWNVLSTFYPKPLRKRMYRLARKNDYQVIKTEGRPTRRWERD